MKVMFDFAVMSTSWRAGPAATGGAGADCGAMEKGTRNRRTRTGHLVVITVCPRVLASAPWPGASGGPPRAAARLHPDRAGGPAPSGTHQQPPAACPAAVAGAQAP